LGVRERVGGAGGCKAQVGREVRGAIAAERIHHECRGAPGAVQILERGL
jgi:hypothetical protein